jgi:hypothetical protein
MNRSSKSVAFSLYTGGIVVESDVSWPGKTAVGMFKGLKFSDQIRLEYQVDANDQAYIKNYEVPPWANGQGNQLYIVFLDNNDAIVKFVKESDPLYQDGIFENLYKGPIVKERIPEPEPEPRPENKLKHQKR